MNRFPEPVQRRQTLIRRLGLVAIGIGRCPICQQRTEVFARRSATPGPTRECCLVCWIVPRYARGQSNKRQRISRWAEQPRQQNGASMMAAKANPGETWLKRQLSDGKEHVAEDLLIRGMMAGYSERTLRRAAQSLQVTRRDAQDEAQKHRALTERWQLPSRHP